MVIIDKKEKSIIYKSLIKYNREIKDIERDISKFETLLESDPKIIASYKEDENWWIKRPFPFFKSDVEREQYYNEQIGILSEQKDKLIIKKDKLLRKLKIKIDIYDRLFYYKYMEGYDYKALLSKVPYSESRFNDYYKTVKELAGEIRSE